MNAAAEIRGAFALLTRLPMREAGVDAGTTGAAAFGVVGTALGLLGVIPLILLARGASEPTLGAIAAVAVVAVTSGFFHLDGLADTTDALLVADPARSEAARHDPAIGAGGATAVVLVLVTQVAALASIAGGASGRLGAAAWVCAVTVSRVLPVFAVRIVPAASIRGGLGTWFTERVRGVDAGWALASVAAVVIVAAVVVGSASDAAIIGLGTTLGATIGLAVALSLAAARGGLDGDGFGATIELTLCAVLVTTAVLAP